MAWRFLHKSCFSGKIPVSGNVIYVTFGSSRSWKYHDSCWQSKSDACHPSLGVAWFSVRDISWFFFFDKKKEVYSRSYLIQKSIRQTKDCRKYKNKNKKQRKKLITKERSKERNERITRSESPSPRPIKKGTT